MGTLIVTSGSGHSGGVPVRRELDVKVLEVMEDAGMPRCDILGRGLLIGKDAPKLADGGLPFKMASAKLRSEVLSSDVVKLFHWDVGC